MRRLNRSQRYVNDGGRLGQRRGRGWRRSLALLTLTLAACSWNNTIALARQSSVFGPAVATTATRMGVQDPLTPEQQRQIAATLAECEGVAAEAETLREENGILRQAVKLLEESHGIVKEAVRMSNERAEAEARRADAESRRANIEKGLHDAAEANLKREKRAGKWRALRWGAAALGIGVVVGVVMGGE